MPLEDAQQFVTKMRQEKAFRIAACKAAMDQELEPFLQGHGGDFELHNLVQAMAECMDEMDRGCTKSG